MYRTLKYDSDSHTRGGYLKVSEVYEMNWRDAQPDWGDAPGEPRKLDRGSLGVVVFAVTKIAKYKPERETLLVAYPSAVEAAQSGSSKASPAVSGLDIPFQAASQSGSAPESATHSAPGRTMNASTICSQTSASSSTLQRTSQPLQPAPRPPQSSSGTLRPGHVGGRYGFGGAYYPPYSIAPERRPLLPSHYVGHGASGSNGSGGVFHKIWSFLKRVILVTGVGFLFYLVWRFTRK